MLGFPQACNNSDLLLWIWGFEIPHISYFSDSKIHIFFAKRFRGSGIVLKYSTNPGLHFLYRSYGWKPLRKIPTMKFIIFRSIFFTTEFYIFGYKNFFRENSHRNFYCNNNYHYDAYFGHRHQIPGSCELEIWLFESWSAPNKNFRIFQKILFERRKPPIPP